MRAAAAGAAVRVSPGFGAVVPSKVVFWNHWGLGYGCNPKYVCESLRQRNPGALDLVWLVAKADPCIPPDVRQVPIGGVQAARELASARVWVGNARIRRHVPKKSGQFYVQTWHGGVGPKHIEADAAHLPPAYAWGAKRDGAECDLLIANNDLYERVMHASFFYDGPVLRCGMPRNKVLLDYGKALRSRVREAIGVDADVNICLWAPTFRDGGGAPASLPTPEKLLSALQHRFGGTFVLVTRLHPNDVAGGMQRLGEGVVNASWYPDVQELLAATDVLVTDYSSIAEDFALTGRPGYLFVPDAALYEQSRGFYYPLDVRPYPAAFTEGELLSLVRTTADEEFAVRREEFFRLVGLEEDGKGDEVVAQIVEEVVGIGR